MNNFVFSDYRPNLETLYVTIFFFFFKNTEYNYTVGINN